jgi:GntR family transcriptional regulator, vanillate catabolism transcriptional regulator
MPDTDRSSSTSFPDGDRDAASQTARALIGIRELVLRGEFQRGERISEIPLSKRLGTSRTPVRVALERLAHMGLLEAGPTGGFLVREFTLDEVRDAIELRGVLEGTAARLAAERLTSERELDRLRRFHEEVNSFSELTMDSFEHYIDSNEGLHAEIVRLARSDMLFRMLEQANSLPFASPSAMVFPTSMLAASKRTLGVAQEQHRSLLEAIQSKEGSRAEHIAREHARLAWHIFQLALSDDDVLSVVPGEPLINTSAR